MIPFQGRLPCLQYVKNKPNPAGVMLFVPCGRLEMVYRFDFYQSKNTGIPAEYKTLVLVESVVMCLVENLPQIEKFILTFFSPVYYWWLSSKTKHFVRLEFWKLILDLLTMSVVIAWIEYGEWERKKGMKRNHILDLISFREEFDQTLCKAELSPNRVTWRPSFQSLLKYCPIPEKKTPPVIHTACDLCYDESDHWPETTQMKYAQECRSKTVSHHGCPRTEKKKKKKHWLKRPIAVPKNEILTKI